MPGHKAMGGHHSPVNQTAVWLTPPEIISALGEFDLDPCAAPDPRPWETARRGYTERGLEQPWSGRVWLNPPYGGPSIITPWMRKMVAHNRGTALLFARTETVMFHECVWGVAAAIFFFAGRLHFHRPDGSRAPANAGAPSCLIAYGEEDARVLRDCALPGRFLSIPRQKSRFPVDIRTAVSDITVSKRGDNSVPKIKLLDDPAVVELLTKRVAQAETSAQKTAQRTYKAILKTTREVLTTSNLDKKLAKNLTGHLLGALAQHAPGAPEQQAAE